MANNRLPDALSGLFTLAEDMIDGLSAQQDNVGIKQNRADTVQLALTAARAAQAAYADAKTNKAALTTATTLADSNAKAYIGTVRKVLEVALGGEWSAAWQAVGFPNNSLAVPGTVAARQELLASLAAYFTAHPAKENAPLNVTAARGQALFIALGDARSAVNQHLSATAEAKAARDTAEESLRTRMRGLIGELETLLDDTDPRWAAFGLNAPGASATPDVPDGLVVTVGPAGSGTLYLDWDDAPRADRYRVWKQVVGVDVAAVAIATVDDSDATIHGLPVGKTLKLHITAVNAAGESAAGAVVEAITG